MISQRGGGRAAAPDHPQQVRQGGGGVVPLGKAQNCLQGRND